MRPKIAKFGFEIEGEFGNELRNKLIDYGHIKYDGSINYCERNTKWGPVHAQRMWNRRHKNITSILEFVSRPIPATKEGIKEANRILELFQQGWENQEFHYNKSCGFHIHISTRPRLPVDLWSEQFIKYFLREIQKKFPKVWEKRKDNRYCDGSERIITEGLNGYPTRYLAINVRPAYQKHGTIEFRIWPADRPAKMGKYLEFTIRKVSYFLRHSHEFLKEEFSVELEDKVDIKNIEAKVKEKINAVDINEIVSGANNNV